MDNRAKNLAGTCARVAPEADALEQGDKISLTTIEASISRQMFHT